MKPPHHYDGDTYIAKMIILRRCLYRLLDGYDGYWSAIRIEDVFLTENLNVTAPGNSMRGVQSQLLATRLRVLSSRITTRRILPGYYFLNMVCVK